MTPLHTLHCRGTWASGSTHSHPPSKQQCHGTWLSQKVKREGKCHRERHDTSDLRDSLSPFMLPGALLFLLLPSLPPFYSRCKFWILKAKFSQLLPLLLLLPFCSLIHSLWMNQRHVGKNKYMHCLVEDKTHHSNAVQIQGIYLRLRPTGTQNICEKSVCASTMPSDHLHFLIKRQQYSWQTSLITPLFWKLGYNRLGSLFSCIDPPSLPLRPSISPPLSKDYLCISLFA